MEREKWEIKNYPEGEKEEIRQIYIRKGFSGSILSKILQVITANKKVWLNSMMEEELKLIAEEKTPIKSALVTFFAFVVLGFVPLLAFLLDSIAIFSIQNIFLISAILTGIALFAVGAMKTFITNVNFFRSGMEMLLVGGLAAGVAYYVGYFLQVMI
jgi:VIT1/CCC1 family predicted Fe2+/Mn2+ transporter